MTKLIVSNRKGGIFRSGKESKGLRGGVYNVRRTRQCRRSTPLTRKRTFPGGAGLRHIENGDPLGRLELKHFFRKAGVRGDIGKFYDSGIAQSIFKTDLQNE